jgi:hypothetical protein
MSREWIGAEMFTYELRQAIETAAHVGMLGADENAHRQGQAQHGPPSTKAARTCRNVAVILAEMMTQIKP